MKIYYPLNKSLVNKIASIVLFSIILCFGKTLLAENEIKLTSDIVEYVGKEQKTIVAKNNVKIERGRETLTADYMIYHVDSNKVEASGNVVYKDSEGNVITADKLDIEGNFKEAIIYSLTMHTKSDDTIRAKEGQKLDQKQYHFNDVYYTPCKLCGDNNALWSLKAQDVNFDDQKKVLEYKHARFYLGKVPVLYFPYFTHGTKDAERKSGILRVSTGMNSNIGAFIKIPYYLNIAPDKDATFTFIPTNRDNPIFEGEYRHLTDWGSYSVNGIFTKPNPNNKKTGDFSGDTRYNIKSRGLFLLDKDFNLDYNLNYTSDQNFLRTYGFASQDYTKSNISTNYYNDNNYIKVEALYFQNLRYGELKDCNPLVAPHINSYYETNISDQSDVKYYNKFDYLYLHKNDSHTINRFSINNGLKKVHYTDHGYYFTFKTDIRTDLYSYNLSRPLPNKPTESDQNRIIPEFISEWHYPNYAFINNNLFLVEPLTQIKVAPSKNYNHNIYNEDSQDSELSFSNLFADSKFTGLDMVERGTRMSYGVKTQSFIEKKTNIGFMVGQSYSTAKYSKNNLDNIDYERKLSNYVSLLTLNYNNEYILNSRFKVDNKNLALMSNELSFEYRKEYLYFTTEYVSYKNSINPENLLTIGRKEINFEVGTNYLKNWQLSLKARNNLNKNFSQDFKRGLLNLESNITYFYDCMGFKLKLYRDFTNPVGSKPSNGFTFGLILKNIN